MIDLYTGAKAKNFTKEVHYRYISFIAESGSENAWNIICCVMEVLRMGSPNQKYVPIHDTSEPPRRRFRRSIIGRYLTFGWGRGAGVNYIYAPWRLYLLRRRIKTLLSSEKR